MRLSTAVPLAVATALLTLLCSGRMIGQSMGQSRANVVLGNDAGGLPSLGEYFSNAGDAPAAVVESAKPMAATPPLSASKPADSPAAKPAATVAAPVAGAAAALPADYYEGDFLVAQVAAPPPNDGGRYLRTLLKSLLGMAVVLKRTLVLPAALCNCKGPKLDQCEGEPAGAPFECPLRVALDAERWKETSIVKFRSAHFMHREFPQELKRSHVRLLLPDGMDEGELSYALRMYQRGSKAGATRILEVETAEKAYCGWDTRMPGNAQRMQDFTRVADGLLESGGASAVPLHVCTHYRGGTGEVLQFLNVGQADEKHQVTASRDRLPPAIRELPKDTDVMVTFATGSVSTMACNWVETVRRAGIKTEVLIGALDQQMMDACEANGVPCVLIDGGDITKQLADRRSGNVRNDPAIYPKMSVLKVGFYRELLTFGFNVWACDADAVFMNDPRPMLREHPWSAADIAIATDCIDLPSDARYPLLHCDFNTGLVYLRSRQVVLDFVERWRDTVANAKETRIRDQAAFNMLTKARPLQQYKEGGSWLKRIFTSSISGIGDVKLGVLPLAQYLNGHTYFVQHAHTLPNAAQPLSVHMTYQFAEGSKFAYGKRQRLREAGLWLVDEDAYYNGRYVTVSAAHANLELKPMGPQVDSRDAVKYHLAETAHRSKAIRALLGIAKATGRDVILPRMLCYCDFMWKEMRNCRVGGAESMRLPFDCPMDHVLNTPKFFENNFGVGVREANFLKNARVPANVSSSIARVALPKGLNDVEVVQALKPHAHAAIIEIDDAVDTFCGFAAPAMDDAYRREADALLSYSRTPFCMMEGSNNAPLFSQCCSPRKPGDKFFPCISGELPNGKDLPACAHPAIP